MKKIACFCLIITTILTILSCGKEKSFEKNIVTLSEGTLKSATGNCLPAVLNGVYKPGTALNATNYIEIQVDVTKTGKYLIASSAVNGYSFSEEGNFDAPGINTVRLKGTGVPVSASINSFEITYNTSICNIEVSVIDPNTPPAVFSLGTGNTAPCANAVLNGTYQAGTAMNASNTLSISVDVATAGTYTVSVASVNGISFTKSGIFATTGPQTITLAASGTPALAGSFFGVISGAGSCTFPIPIAPAAGGSTPAVYTLSGQPGACATPVINGTYQERVALTTSNTIVVKVDVTTAGNYSLSTDIVNGITFSATGTLAIGSNQSITLKGSGTPTAIGTNTFTPSFGTSACTFNVTTVAAPPAAPASYSCKIDGTLITFNDRADASLIDGFQEQYLHLDGYTGPATGGTVPQFQIFITNNNGSAVKPGTYNVDGFLTPGYRIEIDYHVQNPDNSVTIWNTSSSLFSPNPPFTVIVTSITSTRVKGTFSGKITNTLQGGTIQKTVTEGVFDLPVN